MSIKKVGRITRADAQALFITLRFAQNYGHPFCPRCGCTNVYTITTRDKFKVEQLAHTLERRSRDRWCVLRGGLRGFERGDGWIADLRQDERGACRNHRPAFKGKVALATARGEKALAEPARRYDMHPTLINQWRSRLLEGAADVTVPRAKLGEPAIFNGDQGSRFTSAAFTAVLLRDGIAIGMDAQGCWRDNVFVERPWRSVRHEEA